MTKLLATEFCVLLGPSGSGKSTLLNILGLVLISSISRIVLQKNENSIAMLKNLGYSANEIRSLYVRSTFYVAAISALISSALGAWTINKIWHAMLMRMTGWFSFTLSAQSHVWIAVLELIGYFLVSFFDWRQVTKVDMNQALKDQDD